MKLNYVKYVIVTFIIFAIEINIISYFSPGNFAEIPDAHIIASGKGCHEASPIKANSSCTKEDDFKPQSLPAIYRDRNGTSHLVMRMRFGFDRDVVPDGIAAIYIPKISDAIEMKLNGETIVDMGDLAQPPIRHWNKPVFVTVPRSLLKDTNELEIAASAYQPDGAMLHPFYVAPEHVLKSSYQVRYWLTAGVSQLGMALMTMAAILFGYLFAANKFQSTYGWLFLASISAFVFISHFVISQMPFSYNIWTIAWNFALNLMLLSLYMFTARYLGQKPGIFERVLCAFPLILLITLTIIPNSYILDVGGIVHISTMILGFASAVLLLAHWEKKRITNFIILFVIFSFSLSFGIRDWIYVYSDPTSINMLTSQFAIVLLMGAYVWLAASDLIQSVKNFNHLNDGLQRTIDETSKELEQSYQRLAEVEKREVLERERQRIMLDLHDGVGGQLVNTLAYMETQSTADPTVRMSLQDALRDLGLMVDSLESHDSLTTSLGMLRSRLEPLLEATGISFNWRVKDEPVLEHSSPSQNLNILRIAQEAITNAVKHANASIISVETDASSITIRDNGRGLKIKLSPVGKRTNSGVGLLSMRKRAASVGAKLSVRTSTSGTTVKLMWKPK